MVPGVTGNRSSLDPERFRALFFNNLSNEANSAEAAVMSCCGSGKGMLYSESMYKHLYERNVVKIDECCGGVMPGFCGESRESLGLYGQALKRTWWMPWQPEAMKDVVACDKVR